MARTPNGNAGTRSVSSKTQQSSIHALYDSKARPQLGSPLSALAFLEEVLATADTLVTLAKRGCMVPELQNPRIRELFIKHYRLLYEIEDRAVYVLGLIHGAREFQPDETN